MSEPMRDRVHDALAEIEGAAVIVTSSGLALIDLDAGNLWLVQVSLAELAPVPADRAEMQEEARRDG